ncbi:hypothetical protein SEVIR_2G262950v4 [Setaria viridis]
MPSFAVARRGRGACFSEGGDWAKAGRREGACESGGWMDGRGCDDRRGARNGREAPGLFIGEGKGRGETGTRRLVVPFRGRATAAAKGNSDPAPRPCYFRPRPRWRRVEFTDAALPVSAWPPGGTEAVGLAPARERQGEREQRGAPRATARLGPRAGGGWIREAGARLGIERSVRKDSISRTRSHGTDGACAGWSVPAVCARVGLGWVGLGSGTGASSRPG